MEIFDIRNALSEEPSKAELLQFLDTYETTRAAESAYKWLIGKSSQQQQIQQSVVTGGAETRKSTRSTLVNGAASISMWQILSNLAKLGERAGFTIDTTIQNEKLVFVIANIPEDKAAALLIQELLAIIFARFSHVEWLVNHTKNTTTATISMN